MANWTAEQQQAIYTRNCNLLVSAAAGSGKTAVLVERIIQYICDERNGVDVDQLLVVTFTNAAAAEMRERIGQAINEALRENPHSRHLYRQSTLLNKAAIMTLHSFCLEIVRENFYRLNIDPNFRIADDTEGELLRLDVLEDLLENYYTNAEEDDYFIKLVDAYGGQYDDSLIKELVLKLYDFSRSHPWPSHWLQQVQQDFTTIDWFDVLRESVAIEVGGAKALLQQAQRLANAPGGPAVYDATIEQELVQVSEILKAVGQSWSQLCLKFDNVQFNRLPGAKKDEVDAEIQARVKDLRNKAKDKVNQLKNKYFRRPAAEQVQDLQRLTPHLRVLCQLVEDFSAAYQREKSERNIMDFNDLEHYCLQLLQHETAKPDSIIPSDLSNSLKERFVEVLVDEYQDTNEVQETILQLVTKENNLFMVGDVKQSIYRFRLAKPELFLHKYLTYNVGEGVSQRLDLTKNFRCRQEVVDGVNFVFQQIMTPKLGEIPYDERARLVYGAHYPDAGERPHLSGPVEVYLLDKDSADEEPAEELTVLAKEARVIGGKIKQMLDQGYNVYDKNSDSYRLLTYRDIVILLRSLKGSAEDIAEQFRQLGIPVYADLGSGYFAATEVQTMLALLKIIDNPQQDIPLAAVLRSPLVGLSAEELAKIRLHDQDGDFYQAVVKTAAEKTSLGQRLQQFLQQLDHWRTLARQGNLADLIWTLYRQTGYYHYVGAMPEGSQRQANLRALHDRARRYEETSFRGLFRFLRFLERLQQNKGDMEAAKALGENENVVRIMSIHKSKGLEFPVVFVAGLGKQFNFQELRQDVVLHKDLGLGLVYIDAQKRIKYPTIAKMAIEHRVKLETLAEEMRILYVALTRAREKLVLVGSVRDLPQAIASWCNFLDHTSMELPDSELSQAKTYLDWLGPALIRHRDGQTMRQFVGCAETEHIIDHPSHWHIVLPADNEQQPAPQEDEETSAVLKLVRQGQPVPLSSEWRQQVAARLSWQYPYQGLHDKRVKVSVTEIKHKFQQWAQPDDAAPITPEFSKRPVFLQQQEQLTAAEKGSALHLVMQHVDLSQSVTPEYLHQLLDDLERREILTPVERTVVDVEIVAHFFTQSLGQRLCKAYQTNRYQVLREIPFSLALPAEEIYPDLAGQSEKVLLQGVIDCLWQEEDGWVVLDYKSDYVAPGRVDQIIQRYQGQINLYRRAVETILGQKVKEGYLYLFNIGTAVLV